MTTSIELTDSTSEIVTVPLPAEREGDPLQRQPDITRAREQLGWTPKIDLETGLRSTIAYFDQMLSGGST